jgi:uncharacterized membrane protein
MRVPAYRQVIFPHVDRHRNCNGLSTVWLKADFALLRSPLHKGKRMLADPKSLRIPAEHSCSWQPGMSQNVGEWERWLSAAAGLGLVGLGLRHGSLLRLLAGAGLLYRGMTGHCSMYQALGIDTADHSDAVAVPAQQGVKIEESVIIQRPAAELFDFWRQLDLLPRVFQHLKEVTLRSQRESHWVAEGPYNTDIEWDAELFNERPNELIAWRSLPGGDLETAGSVRFQSRDNARSTELTVSLKYNPPMGKVGAVTSAWLGADPTRMLKEDLQNFKRQVEAGQLLGEVRSPGAHA